MQTEETNLRAQFAARITAAWHKSREKIIALGNALIEARQQLSAPEFEAMLANDLPFGYDNARRFMRIAADPRVAKVATSQILPGTVNAMDTLRRLSDEQFEGAIAAGVIHPDMTVADARDYVRGLKSNSPHRPQHTAILPPAPPEGFQMGTAGAAAAQASTYSELVWLFIQRRHALGYSQEHLDHITGWTAGMTSKLEIPHAADGRFAGALTLNVWLTALRAKVQVVSI